MVRVTLPDAFLLVQCFLLVDLTRLDAEQARDRQRHKLVGNIHSERTTLITCTANHGQCVCSIFGVLFRCY